MTAGQPLTVRHVASIAGLDRDAWNRLFPGRAEGWGYFKACEEAAPAGFAASALGVYSGDELVGAAPLFRTDYQLDLSLKGALKAPIDWLRRNAPQFVIVPALSVGSPLSEECPIGIAPGMTPRERGEVFEALLRGLDAHADAGSVPLLALKDVTDVDAGWAQPILADTGFTRVATLPIAALHLPFKSEAEYLDSLSASMRSDLRRKMRQAADVRIELRDTIDGIEDEIVALFEETKAHRKTDYGAFDDVPADYFREVMQNLPGTAHVLVCRVGRTLASFNLFLVEPERVIGKYIGMRYALAREHNLYFVNWMATVRLCIERGIPWLQTGQTSYRQKVRLGCKLKRSWVYFKDRRRLINPLFKTFGPRMAFDRMDPDLQALGDAAPYLDAGTAP
jgi:predicted N-acyltransferase